jgi:hypothetical protein
MAGGDSIFQQFERLPKEEQQRKLQSLAPEELDQFENDYNAYQLQSGADRYQRVARSGLAEPTQTTKPSNSQILQSTGKEAGKAVVKEGVKEGVKQGAKKVVGEGIAANASQLGVGPTTGIVAGTYLAGKSAYDSLTGKPEDKSAQGKFGRGQLAWTTGGLSEVARLFGIGGEHKSGKDLIDERVQALQDKGVEIPQELLDEYNTYGLSQDELVKRAEESGGSTAFARTRDEKDLTPEDTWGGLMWQEVKGNDYLGTTTENQRREMNQRALDEGLIDESRGALNFKDENRAAQIYDEVMADTPPVMPGETKDGEPYSLQTPSARKDGETQDKRRPKPKLNDIPVPQPQPAPTPEIRTPKDYAQAYMDVYNANSQLSGVNPYLRRY